MKEKIYSWISATINEPSILAKTGRKNGRLLAIDHDLGLDWTVLGISKDSAVMEFYGKDVDYQELRKGDVEAVVLGYGFGYRLVFKLKQGMDIEEKIKEDAKKPYGGVDIEQLDPNVMLVCQKPR